MLQWTNGQAKVITFKTVLFSRDKSEATDLEFLLDEFLNLAEKNDTLGRPPICLFTYGSVVSETVVVESINHDIKSVIYNGELREVELSFTLRKYKAFNQLEIDPNKPTTESYYLVATSIEQSYETIAKRFYGDPLLGDRLRKRNPQSPFAPQIGEKIRVPSRSIISREEVSPASHIFDQDDERALNAKAVILDDRNDRKVVIVV
jgi:hypothetical protein